MCGRGYIDIGAYWTYHWSQRSRLLVSISRCVDIARYLGHICSSRARRSRPRQLVPTLPRRPAWYVYQIPGYAHRRLVATLDTDNGGPRPPPPAHGSHKHVCVCVCRDTRHGQRGTQAPAPGGGHVCVCVCVCVSRHWTRATGAYEEGRSSLPSVIATVSPTRYSRCNRHSRVSPTRAFPVSLLLEYLQHVSV